MKTIAIISTLLASIQAAPAGTDSFAIKTVSSDPRFDNQYIYSYHTGAGAGDAALYPTNPKQYYRLKDGRIMSDVYSNPGAHAEAGLQAFTALYYDNWYPVSIDLGKGSKGFTYSKEDGFLFQKGGFIVCNWAHDGAAQLFVLVHTTKVDPLLSNCGKVKLVKASKD